MLHAVIMAGGSGTRFWPASREARPKQLLRLIGERTMIQATIDRLETLVPPERVLIVTSAALVDEMHKQLPELAATSLIGEPCRRDTAPCIGLAALVIARHDPDAIMAVMPADHVIAPAARLRECIALAERLVREQPQRIVTFGVRPTYAAESFGYVERGAPLTGAAGAYQVTKFREKPTADVAKQYLEAGTFYWNSGIFVWQAATVLAALEARQPQMMAHLKAIVAAFGKPEWKEVFAREFAAIKGISIDYAVMEQASDVVVIEGTFDWQDVGSWQAAARLQGADSEGNAISGRHVGVRTQGTIVRGDDQHLIATLGVSDLIVVRTPDATLVASKHDEEAIRELVKIIAQRGWQQYL